MEIREMINTKLEDVIHQIRNCDTLAQHQEVHSDGDVDMYTHSPPQHGRRTRMPCPLPPMPPVMIPPPLLPPMVNGGVPGMGHQQMHIPIGGPGQPIMHPKSFQFPLQNLDINDGSGYGSWNSTPQLHSSDSSTSTTPTSKSRERSLTPDEEVMGFLQFSEGRNAGLVVPEMMLPPSVQPTA